MRRSSYKLDPDFERCQGVVDCCRDRPVRLCATCGIATSAMFRYRIEGEPQWRAGCAECVAEVAGRYDTFTFGGRMTLLRRRGFF